jgi:hypothetical protein
VGEGNEMFQVQLCGEVATKGELPQEVRESCREALAALRAALESGALERALSGPEECRASPATGSGAGTTAGSSPGAA